MTFFIHEICTCTTSTCADIFITFGDKSSFEQNVCINHGGEEQGKMNYVQGNWCVIFYFMLIFWLVVLGLTAL